MLIRVSAAAARSWPCQKRARSDVSARSLPHATQLRTAHLRGRQRHWRVRGDNERKQKRPPGAAECEQAQGGGGWLVHPIFSQTPDLKLTSSRNWCSGSVSGFSPSGSSGAETKNEFD